MLERSLLAKSRQIALYLITSSLIVVSGYKLLERLIPDASHQDYSWAYLTFVIALSLIVSAFLVPSRPYFGARLALITVRLGCVFYLFLLLVSFLGSAFYIFVLPDVYIMVWMPLISLYVVLVFSRRILNARK